DQNIPTLPIIKKDGATLYITRDFAALKYRIETFDPVKVLYVVDVAQSLHFRQLLMGAAKFSWYKPIGEHISFGRMQMKDSRMSTRKGTVILLNDVISEAIDRAKELILEKSPELKLPDEVARVVGVGAVKYSVLSQNRSTNITFDWDKMLSFDGNSAPYLQYSYARSRSILRKSNDEQAGTIKDPEQTEERTNALIRTFPKFSEAIIHAAIEYKPNIIANYLFDLASKFNSFYNTVPVLKAEDQSSRQRRLKIVEAAGQIIKNGLELLGIEVVEEM
ncbi:arginine--tRNA ligase, partial [Candidatus Peregrinibacteria bacterium]|nr:arginine--tRNA ligase [Candidatus Peregrinibacteria bacterium]